MSRRIALAAAGIACGAALLLAVVAGRTLWPGGGSSHAPAPPPLARQADGVDGALVLACPTAADYDRFALMIGRSRDWTAARRGRCVALEDQPPGRMQYELHHMYRVVERALDYVCVQRAFKEAGELPCYWTSAANLRHIDRTRLTDEQFRQVEELAGQEQQAEAATGDYRFRANRAETDRERQELTTQADQAERRARELRERILAIKPQ